MAKTLAGAKVILQTELFKAFYDAYMTQFESCSDPDGGSANSSANAKMQQKATKYADELSSNMADAIYNFVKEIGIQATLTGSVMAPSGPCVGMIPMTSFKII